MRVGEPIFWERESREIFSECHDKRRIIRFQVHINHILLLQVNINSFERLDLGHLEIFIWVSVFVKNRNQESTDRPVRIGFLDFSFYSDLVGFGPSIPDHNIRDEHIEWGGGGNQA